jgi:regulation of enolase protein 1 (concanavalin A-like superfamily)
MENRRSIGWSEASWLNPPAAVRSDGSDLLVTAREGSDFWRTTSYGFVHDDGHALMTDFVPDTAIEISFIAAFAELYDQAGVLVRVDENTWIKAGVEFTDGVPHLGAVVTRGQSDWSLAAVPDWAGHEVTIRVSRAGDAVTVRARCEDEPWRMVRLAPLDPDAVAVAGPYCCAPTRAGLVVRFTGFAVTDADPGLHAD